MPDPSVVYGPTTVPTNALLESGSVPVRTAKQERGKALRQIVAAFIANTGTLNTGLVFGFSAVAIPQLKAIDSLIQIDMVQASWIGKQTVLFCLIVDQWPKTQNKTDIRALHVWKTAVIFGSHVVNTHFRMAMNLHGSI